MVGDDADEEKDDLDDVVDGFDVVGDVGTDLDGVGESGLSSF